MKGRLGFVSFALFLAIGHGGLAEVPSSLAADRSTAPEIIIDPEYRIIAGGNMPLAMRITNLEALPPQAVVFIRGLPSEVHLSEGKAFQSGVWVVPSNRIAQMRTEIPASFTGRSDISITVATLEGKYLAETRTTLIIVPPPLPVVGALPPAAQKAMRARHRPFRPNWSHFALRPKPGPWQ